MCCLSWRHQTHSFLWDAWNGHRLETLTIVKVDRLGIPSLLRRLNSFLSRWDRHRLEALTFIEDRLGSLLPVRLLLHLIGQLRIIDVSHN